MPKKLITYKQMTGLAMIELAIATPFVLLMILGAAEIGRALYQYNILANAVRSGTRYYAANSTDDAGAKNLVVYGDIFGAGDALLPDLTTGTINTNADLEFVTVDASYAFQFLSGNPLHGLRGLFGYSGSDLLTLRASLTMQIASP